MQYFGGKQRISDKLSTVINNMLKPQQPFVDLFCGSCNIVSKISGDRVKIANDKHYYLIEMFDALQKGWTPPDNCLVEEYHFYKQNRQTYPHIAGFIGFGCSFAGKWWGGYAKNSIGANYCNRAKTSILSKMTTLQDVQFTNFDYKDLQFTNFDYKDLQIPKDSFVYCDIPYKNSTQYCVSEVGRFNHDEFHNWVKANKNNFTCYISEYKNNMPDAFNLVWELESKTYIRNKNNDCIKTIETLYTF